MSQASSQRATNATSSFAATETWDLIATDYEEFAEQLTRPYAEAAVKLAGGFRPGEQALDVAAGPGVLALLAARSGAHVLVRPGGRGCVAGWAETEGAGPNLDEPGKQRLAEAIDPA